MSKKEHNKKTKNKKECEHWWPETIIFTRGKRSFAIRTCLKCFKVEKTNFNWRAVFEVGK